MRHRVMVGLLVVLVVAIGFAVYRSWGTETNQQSASSTSPGSWQPAPVGTVHLPVDNQLLQRLDAESPQLTLLAEDGSRAIVALWRAKTDLTLNQVIGLAPTHYQTLLIDWPDGTQQDIPIDVDLTPRALY